MDAGSLLGAELGLSIKVPTGSPYTGFGFLSLFCLGFERAYLKKKHSKITDESYNVSYDRKKSQNNTSSGSTD